ncbi:ATP-binding protein [Kitasatospora camelliae]|uniref:ATP-binding protein n=1 Tax=Kitasatospora camelliae TaxID=3156397 RepID=A0AAU8JQV7_9ACTN
MESLADGVTRHRHLDFDINGSTSWLRGGTIFVRRALADWNLTSVRDSDDDVVLVARELLSNAVQHSSGPLRLDLDWKGSLLRIAVTDRSHEQPRLENPRGGIGGYGLVIVDRLAVRWASAPEAPGKRVWAEVEVEQDG